jgi:hypothetical protein
MLARPSDWHDIHWASLNGPGSRAERSTRREKFMTAPNNAALRKVTLNAARSKEFPEGSIRHGYDFIAPLTDEGRIDLEAWKAHRGECFAHRFWAAEPSMRGLLVHRAGGHGGSTWAFEWKGVSDEEEEGYRFGDHTFKVGEYVSVREPDGPLLTFRVVSVGKP